MTEITAQEVSGRHEVIHVEISEAIPLSEVPEEALQGDILNYLNQALDEQSRGVESVQTRTIHQAKKHASMHDANILDGVGAQKDQSDPTMVRGIKSILTWMQDANTLTRTQKILDVLATPLDSLHNLREHSEAKNHKNKLMQKIDGALKKLDDWSQSKGKEFFGKAHNAAKTIHESAKEPNAWRNMTRRSDIHFGSGDGRILERPRPVRAKRVELYKKIQEARKNGLPTEDLIAEAHQRDEIAYQYLTNQRNITVDFKEFGKQSSRYVEILPPEGVAPNGETVVIIGGWGTELASFEAAMMEAAMRGFRVIGIAHPDTQFGTTTKAFADAVEHESQPAPLSARIKNSIGALRGQESPDVAQPEYKPTLHAQYFKEAIKAITEDGKFTLIGQSAGGMIVATMLNDAEFAQSVNNAVLVSPAGVAKIPFINQVYGYLSEAKDLLANFDHTPYYSFVSGRKDTVAYDELAKMRIDDPSYADDRSERMRRIKPARTDQEKIDIYKAQQKTYHSKIWKSILTMARRELDVYKSMHLREDAKIVFICGEQDHAAGTTTDIRTMLTGLPEQSTDATAVLRNSKQIVISSNTERNHQAFITQPEITWDAIIDALANR